VLLAGAFMVVLDFFIVNVALPSIATDLGAGESSLRLDDLRQARPAGHRLRAPARARRPAVPPRLTFTARSSGQIVE
jgi:MFS family permease